MRRRWGGHSTPRGRAQGSPGQGRPGRGGGVAGRRVGIWDKRGGPGRPRAEATEPRTGGPPHDRRVDRSSTGGTPLSSGPGRASRRARGRRGCSAQSAVPGGRTGPRRLTSGLRAPAPAITGRAPLQLRREVPLGGPAAAGRGPTASRAGAARRRSPRRGRAAPRRRRLALGSPLGCGRGRGLPGPVRSRWTTVSQIGQQGEQRGAQIGLPSGGLRRAGPGAPGSRRRAGRGRRGRPLQRGLAGAGGGGGQVRGGGAGDGGQKPEKTGGGGGYETARAGAGPQAVRYPGCDPARPGRRPPGEWTSRWGPCWSRQRQRRSRRRQQSRRRTAPARTRTRCTATRSGTRAAGPRPGRARPARGPRATP